MRLNRTFPYYHLQISDFTRKLLLVYAILSFSVMMAGCGLAWLNTLQSVVPVALNMVVSILALIAALQGKTLSAAEVTVVTDGATTVENALTDLENAVQAYQANATSGAIADMENAITVAINSAQKFLTDVHVSDAATQAKFVAIMQLVLSEVQSVATLIPVLKANAGDKITITVPMDTKTFKTLFNEIISTPSGNVTVDAACAKLKRL